MTNNQTIFETYEKKNLKSHQRKWDSETSEGTSTEKSVEIRKRTSLDQRAMKTQKEAEFAWFEIESSLLEISKRHLKI